LKCRVEITRYIFFIVLAFAFLAPFLAISRPFRPALLPDRGENFGCSTCHIDPNGGGPRNPFGKDWEAIAIPQGDKYVPEIANKDSDGDGFTNDEEFKAGTHPGDPQSKPNPPQPVNPQGKSFVPWGKIKSSGRR
jgi:hypothetical protein